MAAGQIHTTGDGGVPAALPPAGWSGQGGPCGADDAPGGAVWICPATCRIITSQKGTEASEPPVVVEGESGQAGAPVPAGAAVRADSKGHLRRLAAIMFMDMVGFCRLTAADEEGTLARWKSLRSDVIDYLVARHHGRVVRVVGDQLLLEFRSAVDAADCALHLQTALQALNADLPPGARMEFRIGVHIGDVIDEGNDLFGADVNLAARLEPLAEPGGIVVSAAMRERLAARAGLCFEDLGNLVLRNVPEPVRAFRCRAADSTLFKADSATLRRPSIAVLPLVNATGDRSQYHLAAGVMEEVIAALARLPSLLVISRNSTIGLVGRSESASYIGQVFGVRYVLRGSLSRDGDAIVLETELVDAGSDAVISRQRHAGRMSSVFELQDQLTQATVSSVVPLIEAREMQRLQHSYPNSIDAYDLTLKALAKMVHLSAGDFDEARQLLVQAAAQDDSFATARAWLAKWHMMRIGQGWSAAPDADGIEAGRHAAAAVARDPRDPLALAIHGHLLSYLRHDYDAAVAGLGRAQASTPSHALAWAFSGITHAYLGQGSKAVEHTSYGLRLSPHDVYGFYLHSAHGLSCLINDDAAAAITALEESQRRNPNFSATARLLAVAYARAGDVDKAREAGRRLMTMEPEFRVGRFRQGYALRDAARREEFADLLRLSGAPE